MNISQFASILHQINKTDRYNLVVVDGETGEGKSCFTDKLSEAYGKISGTGYQRTRNMTYLRKELEVMVDGDKEGKGKLPEYSVVHADELISMFFKRNWMDIDQIKGIELLNKCRDRHFLIAGNIPNFWDLDSGIHPLISFWVHIHQRGTAWVFAKSKNPFTKDKWNSRFNEKQFDKARMSVYKCKGFVTEIKYDDWTDAERKAYYKVRNKKRIATEGQRSRSENYGKIKMQRDELIKFIMHYVNAKDEDRGKVTQTTLAQLTGLDQSVISFVVNKK